MVENFHEDIFCKKYFARGILLNQKCYGVEVCVSHYDSLLISDMSYVHI